MNTDPTSTLPQPRDTPEQTPDQAQKPIKAPPMTPQELREKMNFINGRANTLYQSVLTQVGLNAPEMSLAADQEAPDVSIWEYDKGICAKRETLGSETHRMLKQVAYVNLGLFGFRRLSKGQRISSARVAALSFCADLCTTYSQTPSSVTVTDVWLATHKNPERIPFEAASELPFIQQIRKVAKLFDVTDTIQSVLAWMIKLPIIDMHEADISVTNSMRQAKDLGSRFARGLLTKVTMEEEAEKSAAERNTGKQRSYLLGFGPNLSMHLEWEDKGKNINVTLWRLPVGFDFDYNIEELTADINAEHKQIQVHLRRNELQHQFVLKADELADEYLHNESIQCSRATIRAIAAAQSALHLIQFAPSAST